MGVSSVRQQAPQFGGTLYFKVNNKDAAGKIDDALWDAALGDDYGFDAADKTLLLKEPEDKSIWKRNMTFRAPGDVLYVSANNDEGLEKLGARIAADNDGDIDVIHRPGAVSDYDQTILTRSSGLQENWKPEGSEYAITANRLNALV